MKRPIRNNLVLELHVSDFNKVRKFYSKFGFIELSYDPTSGGSGDLGYLVLKRKDALGITLINFYGDKPKVSKHSHFKEFPASTPRGYGVEIAVQVEDVDNLWKEIKDKIPRKQISQELTMKRWGQKDFRVVDPFGFYLR